MKQDTAQVKNHYCTILDQRHLVSEMSLCDNSYKSHEKKYKCYLNATKKNRENKACMYS